MSLESSKHSLTYFEGFDMLITQRQFLGLLDNGIAITQLNSYIQQKPELFDGEHSEVEAALKKVLGVDFDKVITYSRENNVVYSL